jgi:TIR domain
MSSKVFISYRRDDSAAHAGRVDDRLEREFGRDSLFMDVDAIPLGVDFVEVLGAEVAKCDVLLAIIGPNWLHARDEEGNRRLEREPDAWRTGDECLERAFCLYLLSSAVRVQPIWRSGTLRPAPGQYSQRRRMGGSTEACRGAVSR